MVYKGINTSSAVAKPINDDDDDDSYVDYFYDDPGLLPELST